jgi:hypothetical protein
MIEFTENYKINVKEVVSISNIPNLGNHQQIQIYNCP